MIEDTIRSRDSPHGRWATEALKLAILESALDPIITLDEEGRIVEFNSAAERVFGFSRSDVVDRRAGHVIVPVRLRDAHFRALAWLRKAGDSPLLRRPVETTALRADGSEFPVELMVKRVDLSGRVYFTTSLRDLTTRKQTEATLAQVASIIRSTDDAIIGETPEGTIVSWNPAAVRIFGYSIPEISGRPSSILVPPELAPEVPAIRRRVTTGRSISHYETVRLTKEKRRIHVSLTTSPIKDRYGRVTGIATIGRDITERKAAEVTRAELEQQLSQSQKLEAIGRLAGGIAHDFKNLLAVIINYASFLTQDSDDQDRRNEDIERIRQASSSAVSLINQLLVFSRKQAAPPQIVDANELVMSMEKLLRRSMGEDVTLETRLDADLGLTSIDPGSFEQILLNLAVNTRDAMPHGGSLQIETSNATVDHYLARQHPALAPGEYVRVTVADTGSGMPPEVVSRIFEPFFTTKPEDKGTGLGLATVYAIVRQAHGGIAVKSEPGEGTTFHIYLPVTEGEAEPVGAEDEIRIESGGGQTIVVVEDEDLVLRLAQRILSDHGYRVLVARSGAEALEICHDIDVIDLLLTDVVMPQMSGHELARWLAQDKHGFQIVYMSGYARDDLTQTMAEPGATLLHKPFTADELLRAVQESLALSTR